MEEKKWENPNKMLCESGHKAFDRQTVCISFGNVISPTQYSSFIRSRDAVECSGQTFPHGHLRDFDLASAKWEGMPAWVFRAVKELTDTREIILYQFHHYENCRGRGGWSHRQTKERRKVIDGYIATTPDHKLIRKFYVNSNHESARKILGYAERFVCQKDTGLFAGAMTGNVDGNTQKALDAILPKDIMVIQKIPKAEAEYWQKVLDGPTVEIEKECAVLKTWTVKIPNTDYEVDIKICNGDKPYVDPVMFDSGSECCVGEVSDTLLGDYHFDMGEVKYIVRVAAE